VRLDETCIEELDICLKGGLLSGLGFGSKEKNSSKKETDDTQ
jgi:hypothetical protein